jgi:hypothetical protein
MFEDAKKQMSALPYWVQLWMRWLNIVFLLGLFFVGGHNEARWAIFAYLVSFPVGFFAFYLVRDIRITGVPHILFWVPLLAYMVQAVLNDPDFQLLSLCGVWILLLSFTITIAVVLDIKGIGEVIFQKRGT